MLSFLMYWPMAIRDWCEMKFLLYQKGCECLTLFGLLPVIGSVTEWCLLLAWFNSFTSYLALNGHWLYGPCIRYKYTVMWRNWRFFYHDHHLGEHSTAFYTHYGHWNLWLYGPFMRYKDAVMWGGWWSCLPRSPFGRTLNCIVYPLSWV